MGTLRTTDAKCLSAYTSLPLGAVRQKQLGPRNGDAPIFRIVKPLARAEEPRMITVDKIAQMEKDVWCECLNITDEVRKKDFRYEMSPTGILEEATTLPSCRSRIQIAGRQHPSLRRG